MDVQTETGKKWLRDFQGSEKRMRERIIEIEQEIRKMIEEESTKGGGRKNG